MTASEGRKPVTPGRLYVLLSAEFRRLTAERCGWCRMPLLKVAERADATGSHWSANDREVCPKCAPVVRELVGRYSREYDVWPVFADSSLGADDKAGR